MRYVNPLIPQETDYYEAGSNPLFSQFLMYFKGIIIAGVYVYLEYILCFNVCGMCVLYLFKQSTSVTQ